MPLADPTQTTILFKMEGHTNGEFGDTATVMRSGILMNCASQLQSVKDQGIDKKFNVGDGRKFAPLNIHRPRIRLGLCRLK